MASNSLAKNKALSSRNRLSSNFDNRSTSSTSRGAALRKTPTNAKKGAHYTVGSSLRKQ